MITSENVNELFAALSKAQGEFETAKKDANNPFFKSKYADLSSVISVIQAPLARHGLAIIQGLHGEEFHTMLTHSSGQFIKMTEPFSPQKNDPQSVGSLKSYIRRYSIMSLLCIATDDDDCEAAMPRVEHDQTSQSDIRRGLLQIPNSKVSVISENSPLSQVTKTETFKITNCISEAQAKRFHAIASKHNWSVEESKKLLMSELGVDSSLKIPRDAYDRICDLLGQRKTDIEFNEKFGDLPT
jgi:hypothetical protein